jgi:hypothetical protein
MTNPTINLGSGKWATKEGELLGYSKFNPKEFLPQSFDVSRASSATVVNRDGLIESVANNIARVDFADNVNGALLLEPQSTNLVTYSQDFDNTYWTKSRVVLTSGQLSPSNDTNAFKIFNEAVTATHFLNINNLAVTSGVDYTFSIFAKKDENNFITIILQGAGWLGSSQQVSFNLQNGTFDYADSGLTFSSVLLKNGFYRIKIKNETAATSVNFRIYTSDTVNNVSSYLGDGVSGVYIYGAQVEESSVATSYIPTSGSTVTRLADLVSNTGISDFIGQTEGTIFLNAKLSVLNDNNQQILLISDGLSQNRIRILSASGSRLRVLFQLGAGAATFGFVYFKNYTDFSNVKIAISYKSGDTKIFIDGGLVNSLSNTFTISNSLIDSSISSNGIDKGLFNSFQLYNTALTDSELTQLTTI